MSRKAVRLSGEMLLVVLLGACTGQSGMVVQGGMDASEDMGLDATDAVDLRPLEEVAELVEGCPEGTVLWPERMICAPMIEQCGPLEMPRIGGGCIEVGPRSCDPAQGPDAGCGASAPAPCPEGFRPSNGDWACVPYFEPDGICAEDEIPLFGGGCAPVGASWFDPAEQFGGVEVPIMDYCPEGQIPVPGGGCLPAGNRACSAIWDAGSEGECEPTEYLPCPEGWADEEETGQCRAVVADCGPGEIPLIGGACEKVLADPGEVGAGPFPELPISAPQVLYVLAASLCVEACGTMDAPFPTIQQALDVAIEGAVILVGPGSYAEGLLVTRSVTVVGLGAAVVRIAGTVSTTLPGQPGITSAGLAVVGAQEVVLKGLALESPAVGAVVYQSSEVVLEAIEIVGSVGLGLVVYHDSTVDADRVWIHGIVGDDSPAQQAVGVVVDDKATLTAEMFLVSEVMGGGGRVKGAGSLSLSQSCIKEVALTGTGTGGFGLSVQDGSKAVLTNLVIEDCVASAILDSASDLLADNITIRTIKLPDSGESGAGIYIAKGSEANISKLDMSGAARLGIYALGEDTSVAIERSVVCDTAPTISGQWGVSVVVIDGAHVVIESSYVYNNMYAGVMSGGEGSLVELTGSVVSGTKSSVTGEIGAGLFCQDQGRGKAVHSLFQGNALYGLEASGPGTTVSAVGCRLTGEVGASVSQGAELSLEASVVEENSGQGIIAYGEGLQEGSSRLTVKDSVIRQNCLEEEDVKYKDAPFEVVVMGLAEATLHGTLVQPTVSGLAVTLEGATLDVSASVVSGVSDLAVGAGRGLRVEQGAKCVIEGSLVEGMADSGVEVAHHLSHLAMDDSVVRRCNRGGTEGYGGILVSVGGVAELLGCSLMENRHAGLYVISIGTDVGIDGGSISNNVPGLDGKVGLGLRVSNGAAAEVTGTLLANNHGMSVAVASEDSSLLLEDSVVTNTNPVMADGDGLVGYGLFVGAEASALLRRSLVSLSVQTGCLVDGSGAVLEAESALVRNTLNNAEEGAPLLPTSAGLWATAGANVELSNSSLADNWPFQMVVLGPESSVVAERTSVLQSQARELYEGEVPLERSVLVADGAHLSMSRCLLMHSAGWGLSAHEEGTSVDMDKCATTRYSQQEVNAFGMGAAVVQGASLLLTDSLFVGNASYAVGAFDGASADIQGCTLASTSPGGEWVEKEPGKVRLQAFGDGLTVVRATASVQDTLFTDNSRCGVYYYQSSGAIEGSLVTRSGAYGLAIYLPSPEVLFEQLSNFIFGNATALTGPTAAEVSKNADGMEVQSSPPKRF